MGGRLNLNGGMLNLDRKMLTLDGGTRPPTIYVLAVDSFETIRNNVSQLLQRSTKYEFNTKAVMPGNLTKTRKIADYCNLLVEHCYKQTFASGTLHNCQLYVVCILIPIFLLFIFFYKKEDRKSYLI